MRSRRKNVQARALVGAGLSVAAQVVHNAARRQEAPFPNGRQSRLALLIPPGYPMGGYRYGYGLAGGDNDDESRRRRWAPTTRQLRQATGRHGHAMRSGTFPPRRRFSRSEARRRPTRQPSARPAMSTPATRRTPFDLSAISHPCVRFGEGRSTPSAPGWSHRASFEASSPSDRRAYGSIGEGVNQRLPQGKSSRMGEQRLLAGSDWRVRLIALFEALKGVLALVLECGLMATFGEGMSEAAQELVLGLHLDPSQGLPNEFINAISGVPHGQMWVVVASALAYWSGSQKHTVCGMAGAGQHGCPP